MSTSARDSQVLSLNNLRERGFFYYDGGKGWVLLETPRTPPKERRAWLGVTPSGGCPGFCPQPRRDFSPAALVVRREPQAKLFSSALLYFEKGQPP